jgi:hypothetical protein
METIWVYQFTMVNLPGFPSAGMTFTKRSFRVHPGLHQCNCWHQTGVSENGGFITMVYTMVVG